MQSIGVIKSWQQSCDTRECLKPLTSTGVCLQAIESIKCKE